MPLEYLDFADFAVLLAMLAGSSGGLIVLWAFVFHGCRGRPGSLSTCGACGHGLKGIASLHCPECGADLRKAGIIGPRQKGRVNPLIFFLIWMTLMPVAACVGSVLLMYAGPQIHFKTLTFFLIPQSNQYEISIEFQVANAASNRFEAANLSIHSNLNADRILGIYTEIDLVAMLEDSSYNIIQYDSLYDSFYRAASPLHTAAAFDKARLLSFLEQVGAKPNDPAVNTEVDELFDLFANPALTIQYDADFEHFENLVTTSYSHSHSAAWRGTFFIGLAVGGLIWIIGAALYIQLRRPAAATAA